MTYNPIFELEQGTERDKELKLLRESISGRVGTGQVLAFSKKLFSFVRKYPVTAAGVTGFLLFGLGKK